MFDDRKRLSKSKTKIQKILDELGPDLAQYLDDIRKPRMVKKNKQFINASFSSGDEVLFNDIYGIVTYGPYYSESNKESYEIEIDGGEIITVEYDGSNIQKFSYIHDQNQEDEDDFF